MIKIKVFEGSTLFEEYEFSDFPHLKVGRGSACDITLEGHPGISREHALFKLSSGKVEVELLSNTGVLIYNGISIGDITVENSNTVLSIPPYDFHFEIQAAEEESPDVAVVDEKEADSFEAPNVPETHASNLAPKEEKSSSPAITSHSSSQEEDSYSNASFDEDDFNDESTSIGAQQPLDYSLKIFKGDSFLQEIAIEGSKWTFGRDKNSDYTINSKKASRHHFNVLKIGNAFYVKDLGSSNGTLLNSQQLPSNQEVELKSGDYIELAEFKFIFEIKDKQFEEKIKNISLIEEQAKSDSHDDLSEIRENALVLNDEVVKLGGQHPGSGDDDGEAEKKKKKTQNIRVGILILFILLGGFYYMQNNQDDTNSKELASKRAEQRKAQEMRNAAIDKFNLALRFYNESQFERCVMEIDEFLNMGIETDETAGARELRNQCDIEKERLQRQKDLELQREKQEEIDRQVQEIIDSCRPVVKEGVQELESCLNPALSLDPANEEMAALIDEAQRLAIKREEEAEARKKYWARVAQGKKIFEQAKDYNKFGDWKKSLKTYDKFINSSYPDPNDLKEEAKRNVASINTLINGKLETALTKSREALNKAEYKEAVLAANKGLEVNRDHEELLEIKNEAAKLLKIILRKYYQESIIEEDFGQIAEAKIKWKKIISEGVPGSEYFKKAQLKLKYYEEGFQ